MKKEYPTLEARVEQLEKTIQAHHIRLVSLEKRLEPQNLSAAALDLLLNQLDEQLGKEVK